MNPQPDFAMGAIGGSGTRLAAGILRQSGYFTGWDLNPMEDCLDFTRLFKDPNWRGRNEMKAAQKRLKLFDALMRSQPLTIWQKFQLKKILKKNPILKITPAEIRHLLNRPTGKVPPLERWGWKEPNAQFYMPAIKAYYPKIKFIYVVRDGLTLAFSKNIQQLKHWGPHYGFSNIQEEDLAIRRQNQLSFWNHLVPIMLQEGKRVFGNNFLAITYEDLCTQPQVVIPKMLNFLNHDISESELKTLIQLPQKPKIKFDSTPEALFGTSLIRDYEATKEKIASYL
jgi:hypothetical protein